MGSGGTDVPFNERIPEPHVASTQSLKTCWFSEELCSQCGSTLITNGQSVWCPFIGGGIKTHGAVT